MPRPGGPYGVSKLAATELVLGSGLDAVVLRVFSPVGPGTPAGSPLGRLAEAMRRAIQAGDGELKLGGLGVQRDGAHPEPAAGADDAEGDLATIGDEEFGEHARYLSLMVVRVMLWLCLSSRIIALPLRRSRGGGNPSLHAYQLRSTRVAKQTT